MMAKIHSRNGTSDARVRWKRCVAICKAVPTGRATPALVERLQVDYYGTPTPLMQMAAIHATDARTITIQPWDKKSLGDIEKAIQKSDIFINPNNDGQVIRLNLPPLTEDRRKELGKVSQEGG